MPPGWQEVSWFWFIVFLKNNTIPLGLATVANSKVTCFERQSRFPVKGVISGVSMAVENEYLKSSPGCLWQLRMNTSSHLRGVYGSWEWIPQVISEVSLAVENEYLKSSPWCLWQLRMNTSSHLRGVFGSWEWIPQENNLRCGWFYCFLIKSISLHAELG
jgi:hypothetical protein